MAGLLQENPGQNPGVALAKERGQNIVRTEGLVSEQDERVRRLLILIRVHFWGNSKGCFFLLVQHEAGSWALVCQPLWQVVILCRGVVELLVEGDSRSP